VARNLFWLSDEQWKQIEAHLPTDVRGVERADDRRVISGIVHVLKSGCRWCDCPPEYGPPTTIYNRFVRWARRGIWENLFRKLAGSGRSTGTQMIDATHIKAHRSAAGGKGGSRSRLLAARAEGAPYLPPRFRALALFERRPHQRVESSHTPAFEKLHSRGLVQRSKRRPYSITSSARERKDSGIVRPSDLAVLRFTISSNLLGS